MNKNGYTHNDLHNANIGIIKSKQKYINILNYKIPTFGYIIKLIDYGFNYHLDTYHTNDDSTWFLLEKKSL